MIQWASLAAFLAGAVLVFDFVTKGIGVVDVVRPYIVPEPMAHVNLKVVNAPGDGSCLEFAFSDLPQDFKLGEISLEIIKADGPTALAGDAAAEIVTRTVNRKIPPSVFRSNPHDIAIPARIAATNAKDAAYVEFCPILARAGTAGTIWVKPKFHGVDGTVLSDLVVSGSGGAFPKEGLPLSLAHPKNISIDLKPSRTKIIAR